MRSADREADKNKIIAYESRQANEMSAHWVQKYTTKQPRQAQSYKGQFQKTSSGRPLSEGSLHGTTVESIRQAQDGDLRN